MSTVSVVTLIQPTMTDTFELFPPDLDTKVSETNINTGFDIHPLIDGFGKDVTWREVYNKEYTELLSLPTYGPKTVDAIYRFISENISSSFVDLLD